MVPYRNSLISVHEDPEFFREAVLFTARDAGLNAALVEQDYFCSLLLSYLYQEEETPLVFRGGTCLSKIYADFYRLSQDLDFVIPTPLTAPRGERRRRIAPFKQWFSTIEAENSVFRVAQALTGHNNSTQYIGHLKYISVADITNEPVAIKMEVGLREDLLDPPVTAEVRTLLMDPFRKEPAVAKINVKTMRMKEVYAEKLRAALTRKEAAIRDFYDVSYAVANLGLDLNDHTLEKYVKKHICDIRNFITYLRHFTPITIFSRKMILGRSFLY